MYRTTFTYALLHRLLSYKTRLLACVLFVGMLCATANTTPTYADSIPGGNVANPAIRAVDIAKPAVVRIITTVSSRLIVHFSSANSVTFPRSGDEYPLQLSGSGTFISAHGDILTADHVINPPHDSSLDQVLDEMAKQDVAAYINQSAQSGSSQVTPDQVAQALESGRLSSTPKYDTTSSEAFLSTDYTGPLDARDVKSLPAQTHAIATIEKESSFDQKDVALVHVPLDDVVSVQLGDSSTVHEQDELTIIGFPGNGDVSHRLTDLLTSSVNKINVSSTKTTDNGAQVIQVGGTVEHGDSGGPALDNNGTVVGIVSFGLSNSDGGSTFLQTSNSARNLVQSLNLDTKPGTLQKQWSQAFTDYASSSPGHWHKAQQEFEQIATRYPLFKAITPYLTYAQNQAKTEQAPTTQPKSTARPALSTIPALAWTIGALALLLLLILLLFGVALRRREKKTPAPSITAQPRVEPIVQPGRVGVSSMKATAPDQEGDLTAFGAPPRVGQPLQVPGQPSLQVPINKSNTLRPWPCGHMNRSTARFCSICGEPAPQAPTIRHVEQ